jgi:predicted dehydrogenase
VVTRDLRKAAAYPEAKAWTTLEEALADPEVRAVYVASPVSRHQEQAIQGLRTGRAVLLEKPVAMNYGEAVSITEAAEQTGTLLGIAYFRRLFPKLIRAKELLAAGAIGTPVLAEACFHGWLESEERAWLRDPALAGGGPLYDTASHRIDALNFIFGAPQWATAPRNWRLRSSASSLAEKLSIFMVYGTSSYTILSWQFLPMMTFSAMAFSVCCVGCEGQARALTRRRGSLRR